MQNISVQTLSPVRLDALHVTSGSRPMLATHDVIIAEDELVWDVRVQQL